MIIFKHIYKSYYNNEILKNISIEVNYKEFICIVGNSGEGKTTILNLILGKEKTDSGNIFIDGISINNLHSQHLQFYRKKIGVIFQDFKLFQNKTIFENISFILEICKEKKDQIFNKVKKSLEIVGLEEKIAHFPSDLSGGEIQRIAIARAIVHDPKIILADEPTGNLDPENTKMILEILKKINREMEATIILATHNPLVSDYLKTRVICLKNGEILYDKMNV